MVRRSLFYPSLKDHKKIYLKYKNFGGQLIVCKHNDFYNTEDTIRTLKISWDDLMGINDHQLLDLLSFKVKSKECIFHKQCYEFRLYDHKEQEISRICRSYNMLPIVRID